jgi:hypothetical protein
MHPSPILPAGVSASRACSHAAAGACCCSGRRAATAAAGVASDPGSCSPAPATAARVAAACSPLLAGRVHPPCRPALPGVGLLGRCPAAAAGGEPTAAKRLARLTLAPAASAIRGDGCCKAPGLASSCWSMRSSCGVMPPGLPAVASRAASRRCCRVPSCCSAAWVDEVVGEPRAKRPSSCSPAMLAAASSRASGTGGWGMCARVSEAGVQGGAAGCSGVSAEALGAERGVPAGRPCGAAAAAGVPAAEAGVHGGAEGWGGVAAACLRPVKGVPAGSRPCTAGDAACAAEAGVQGGADGWSGVAAPGRMADSGVPGGRPCCPEGVAGSAASWGDARQKGLMVERGEPAGRAPAAWPSCATDAGLSVLPGPAAAPKLKLAWPLPPLLLPGAGTKRSSALHAATTSLPEGPTLVAAEAGAAAGQAAACLGATSGVASTGSCPAPSRCRSTDAAARASAGAAGAPRL